MLETWRIGCIGTAAIVLIGCDTDPGSAALLERDAIHDLARSSVSIGAVRTSLTQRGYSCRDAAGSFATEAGTVAFAPRFVACDKVLSRSFFCNYHIHAIAVPRAAGLASEVHVRGEDQCL